MSNDVINLKGHDKQREFLKNIIQGNGFSRPVILFGPEGIGKYLVSQEAFKHYRLQETQVEHTKFEPQSKSLGYTLEEVQAFLQEVKIKPFKKTLRAFVFDDAHKFLPIHANALLKTLEELDDDVVVFFITHSLEEVLPTIRSRCFQLCFQSLSDDLVCQILNQSLEKPLLRQAAGSIKRAQLLLNPDYLKAQALFMQAITAIYAKHFDQLNSLLDQVQKILSQNNKGWIEFLFEILLYFQMDRIRFKYKVTPLMFEENKTIYSELNEIHLIKPEVLLVQIQKMKQLHQLGLSIKYVLEQALITMII